MAIMNYWGAESLGIAGTVIIKQLWSMTQNRHTLEVRYKQAFNEADARQQAWNERRDGGKLGLRLLPNWNAVI